MKQAIQDTKKCIKMIGILNLMSLSMLIIIGITLLSGTPAEEKHFQTSTVSNFSQTINPGTLTVGIVDSAYEAVASPAVEMDPVTFSFDCQSTSGTFGSANQKIYVRNPDSADSGWTVTLAAADSGDVWNSAGTDFDFNDGSSAGCSDGSDQDSLAGQMTVDPSVGTLAVGSCLNCDTTNVSKGTSAAFEEGTVDSITLMTGASSSDDIGDWVLTGVGIAQTIPAEQPAASDYNINMVLTVTAT